MAINDKLMSEPYKNNKIMTTTARREQTQNKPRRRTRLRNSDFNENGQFIAKIRDNQLRANHSPIEISC